MSRYMGKMTTLNARADAQGAREMTALNAAAKENPELIIPDHVIKSMSMTECKSRENELYSKGIFQLTAMDKINLKRITWRKNQLRRAGVKQ